MNSQKMVKYINKGEIMNKKRITFNKPVAINHETNELYILNDLFNHGNNFKGATGSVLYPLAQDYIDEMNDIEHLKDNYDWYWQECVKQGSTQESLEEFCQGLLSHVYYNTDGQFFGHDTSDCFHNGVEELLAKFDDAVCFECIGGGRCFDAEMFNNANVEILDNELVELIKQYETNK